MDCLKDRQPSRRRKDQNLRRHMTSQAPVAERQAQLNSEASTTTSSLQSDDRSSRSIERGGIGETSSIPSKKCFGIPSCRSRRNQRSISHSSTSTYKNHKVAFAQLTSTRLQEAISEFNPPFPRSPRRNAVVPANKPVSDPVTLVRADTPTITVSDEAGNTTNTPTNLPSSKPPIKPPPRPVTPEGGPSTTRGSPSSTRPRIHNNSSSTANSSQTSLSSSLTVPSPSPSPSHGFTTRMRSNASNISRSTISSPIPSNIPSPGGSSSYSNWQRPSSSSSLLPLPLKFSKPTALCGSSSFNASTEYGDDDENTPMPVRVYGGGVREMYSYEELDYRALFKEVSQPHTSGRKGSKKLPFIKRKSSIDVAGEWAKSRTDRIKEKAKARLGSGERKKGEGKEASDRKRHEKERERSISVSSTEDSVASGRSGTPPKIASLPEPEKQAFRDTFLLDVSSDEETSPSAGCPIETKVKAERASRSTAQIHQPKPTNLPPSTSKSKPKPADSLPDPSLNRSASTPIPSSSTKRNPEWRAFRHQCSINSHSNSSSSNSSDGDGKESTTRRQSVRTKEGHRLLQISEAVYDEKGRMVFQPLGLSEGDGKGGEGQKQKDYFVLRRGESLICKTEKSTEVMGKGEGGGEGGVFLVE